MKCFEQDKGFKYDKIFSPVVKMMALWLRLEVVLIGDVDSEQMDMKKTFLLRDLHEDSYMSQLASFTVMGLLIEEEQMQNGVADYMNPTIQERDCKVEEGILG